MREWPFFAKTHVVPLGKLDDFREARTQKKARHWFHRTTNQVLRTVSPAPPRMHSDRTQYESATLFGRDFRTPRT